MHKKEFFLHWDNSESLLVDNVIDVQYKKRFVLNSAGFVMSSVKAFWKVVIFSCASKVCSRENAWILGMVCLI